MLPTSVSRFICITITIDAIFSTINTITRSIKDNAAAVLEWCFLEFMLIEGGCGE